MRWRYYFFVQDIDSVHIILDVFNTFSKYSGFNLNLSKCELCGIGALKGVVTALREVKNVNLTKESIRILGVHFSYHKKLSQEKKFVSVLKQILNVLKVWKMRNLTLIGNINIFNTLAISKFVYISYMSCVPTLVINQLCEIPRDVIWDGKNTKIKHYRLMLTIAKVVCWMLIL